MQNRTILVGIVNITPDSLSDGGRYMDVGVAIDAITHSFSAGAGVVDIGAESTRPGATPLSSDEEWTRLKPVLEKINKIPSRGIISVDTRHFETARKALRLGADWINDVSGFSDERMLEVVQQHDCKLVVMHSLSVPADREHVLPEGTDVMVELTQFIRQKIEVLEKAGINKERIIFDPGIGFGKTATQSWDIIHNIHKLKILGIPLFIGHSRKSFLGGDIAGRDKTTLEVSTMLAKAGIDYLRVHDVASHKKLLDSISL